MRLPLRPHGISLLALLALSGCTGGSAVLHGPSTSQEAAPAPTACPAEVPGSATCLAGKDAIGAY